jgi:imidazole glycerol-phosphate synthase subunit HisH
LKPTVAIIDFGAGNLMSISKALEHLGTSVVVTKDEAVIQTADAAVLPGVGAFYDAMKEIEHLKGIIRGLGDKPLLGVCLGLQLLFSESEEGGRNPGLDILGGRVIRFQGDVKVPHMGWNTVENAGDSKLLKGIEDNSYFYFVHSYYAVPVDDGIVAGRTDYSAKFPSIVEKDNIFATQFHPEKSGTVGLKLLGNFVEIVKGSM